jgi:hypothetical protein
MDFLAAPYSQSTDSTAVPLCVLFKSVSAFTSAKRGNQAEMIFVYV